MRRALLAVVLAGLAALLIAGATDKRDVIAETGLPAVRPAATLAPGQSACRRGLYVTAPFASVRVVADTPSPRLAATAGTGHGAGVGPTIGVGTVAAPRVDVCVRNAGTSPVTLYGVPPDTPVDQLGDPARRAAPAVVLVRGRPVSTLSQVPAIMRRAALFKAGPLGAWTFWLLFAAIAAGLPALLIGALRAAYASECSSSRDVASS